MDFNYGAPQSAIVGRQARLCGRDRDQQQYPPAHQVYRAAAPRSVVSPSWRSTPGDMTTWMPAGNTSEYMLTSSQRSRPTMFDGVVDGYAYCLDRGNGQFTRLVPADMLPPMNEIPPRQVGAAGMVILPPLQAAPPHGIAEMDQPLTVVKVRVSFSSSQVGEKKRLSV